MLRGIVLAEETAGRDRTKCNEINARPASLTAHIEGEVCELGDEAGMRKVDDCSWRIVSMRSINKSGRAAI